VQFGLGDFRLLGAIGHSLAHRALESLFYEAVKVLTRLPRIEHAEPPVHFGRTVG
jgi:hypothetical protein